MASPKFQQTFNQMLLQNQEDFDKFREIHDKYATDPKKYQGEYNEIGRDIQDIVRIYENRLCNSSESTGYGKFSTKLAEKFQIEVKKAFPKYDCIGLE